MIRALLAALWYRLVHDPDTYAPEAADAPAGPTCPVDEHFKTSPKVVAGRDIDRQKAIAQSRADMVFGSIVATGLADLDALDLSAYYVLPEGD